MKSIYFENIWLDNIWRKNIYMQIDEYGIIQWIGNDNPPQKQPEIVKNAFIPGLVNCHSHAFQYAMAGMTEYLADGKNSDNFWSWRDLMYKLSNKISPDHMIHISACLYAEMLKYGITSVAEFHYLHNDLEGRSYRQPATMSHAIIEGARIAGIQLTLIPVYYRLGDFNKPANELQKRFIFKDLNSYFSLIEDLQKIQNDDLIIGTGVHSLRAANTTEVVEVLNNKDHPGPIHMHISEQQKEVDSCITNWGSRPISWVADNIDIGPNHSFIHATHVDTNELDKLAHSGSNVILCPSTEGSLGDGFFPLRDYLLKQGTFSIGTDSHVGLSIFEELRWLDYQQRLHLQSRNVLCHKPLESSGDILFKKCISGGRQSLGIKNKPFSIGSTLDGLSIDMNHPTMFNRDSKYWLSSIIYTGNNHAISGVMRNGKWVVLEGKHIQQGKITENYQTHIRDVL